MLGNPMEIAALVGVAVLLFGADKLPKLARSAGEMRREFNRGQVEAQETQEAKAAEAEKALHGADAHDAATGSTKPTL